MTYALRLPPYLDASARRHADYLGLSFNGFVCVAVEAYLRANPVLPMPSGVPNPPSYPEAVGSSVGGKPDLATPRTAPVDTSPVPPSEAFELVQQVISKPGMGGKPEAKLKKVKKEAFKGRQRTR